MQFDLSRTTAKFGVFHPREEKNKGMAVDIPFSITVGVEILDMLMPPQLADGEEASPDALINELFTVEGYPRRPAINPLKIHRKPEGALVEIYDEKSQGKNGKPLSLKPCSLNKLEIELKSPHQVVLTGQIQYSQYDDKELARINALTSKNYDLTIYIEQVDMFDDKPPAGGEESGGESTDEEHEDPEE